jgi:hypothetical protein
MAKYLNFGYVMTKRESARYFFLAVSEQEFHYLHQGLYDQVAELLKIQGLVDVDFEPLDISHFGPVKVSNVWYDILKPSEGVCQDLEPELWRGLKEIISPKQMKFWAENHSRTILGACCRKYLAEKGVEIIPKDC